MKNDKTNNPEAARYTPFVEWSEEDQCYIGRCPELFIGGVHGADRTVVFAELCQVVDEWIEIFRRDGKQLPPALAGKEFSGKFLLRCEPDQHRLLALRALREGDSLNSYCVKKLVSA